MEMNKETVIGKYIRKLLAEGKRVILPGFGNLQVKEVAGEVPPSGGRINPPGPSVRFDEKYSKDDGLLASAFATGENMDPGEAEQLVLELVGAIQFALDKGESYILADTGTFSRDDEGKVHFQSDPAWVLVPEQYGLDSVELLELDELADEQTGSPGEEVPGAFAPESVPAEEFTPEPEREERTNGHFTPSWMTPDPPARSRRRIGRWRVIWIITASLIMILLLLIFIPVNRSDKGGFQFGREGIILRKKSTGPAVQPVVPPAGESASGAAGNTEGEGASVGDEEKTVTGESPVTERQVPAREEAGEQADQAKYFIIAGSFRHLKNASELQDQLRTRGYPAEVMITGDRMYRVSVASFATQQEALRKLEGIKTEPGLQNCWLLAR